MLKKDESPNAPYSGMQYEVEDVQPPVLGKAAVSLIVFFLMNLVIAGGTYYMFVMRETLPPKSTAPAVPLVGEPNVPILQKDPVAEIHTFRANEYVVEHSYQHWKDGDNKVSLRIPISRAMQIIKENGLTKPVTSTGGVNTPSKVNPIDSRLPQGGEFDPAGGQPKAGESGRDTRGGGVGDGGQNVEGKVPTGSDPGVVAPSTAP